MTKPIEGPAQPSESRPEDKTQLSPELKSSIDQTKKAESKVHFPRKDSDSSLEGRATFPSNVEEKKY